MSTSLLTSKGRITIPKDIRDCLHIERGDRVDFFIEDDGAVSLKPVNLDILDLEGALSRHGMKKVADNKIKSAVKERFRVFSR